MNIKKELEKDFNKCVKEINAEYYNPLSKAFVKTVLIGQMIELSKYINNESSFIEDVEEELEGAEKYLEYYDASNDVSFKDMALEELRHAGILIKKYLLKTDDECIKRKLNEYEEKRNDMIKSLEKSSYSIKAD